MQIEATDLDFYFILREMGEYLKKGGKSKRSKEDKNILFLFFFVREQIVVQSG